MREEMPQEEAGQILRESMKSLQWGWATPRITNLLAAAHRTVDGTVDCQWNMRPNINRIECKHGYLFQIIPLMVMAGAWNN